MAGPPATSPQPIPASSSATPLAAKLGVRPGFRVALLGAPDAFAIPGLPDGAVVRRDGRGSADLTVWFVHSAAELKRECSRLAPRAASGGLWICWPKRTSGVRTDVRKRAVRETGLAAGLVDFKVAAIDAVWSGLRFSIAGRTG